MTLTATPAYQTVVTGTFTLASLATSSTLLVGRECTAFDNAATDLAIDCLVGGKITTGTSPTAAKQIEIWCAASYDGTTYTASATGADAALTTTAESKSLLKLVTIIPTNSTSNVTYAWGPFSIAQLFGGTMPRKWNLFVTHNTAVNLHATAGNHELKYTPIKYQSA
jgi:hypothetical protein